MIVRLTIGGLLEFVRFLEAGADKKAKRGVRGGGLEGRAILGQHRAF